MVESSPERIMAVKEAILKELITLVSEDSGFPVSAVWLIGRVYNRFRYGSEEDVTFPELVDSYQGLIQDKILLAPENKLGVRFGGGKLASE